MECGLCGTPNRASARFCGGCGSPLARECPTCKADLEAGLRFCDQCGTALDDAPAPAAVVASAPDATRKSITALFADLSGSTGFGERNDPEIARQVLARYHALLQAAIDAHDGTVAKFMGDGMMATFGIPEVAEDDALRAVRAGVEIQTRFAPFAAEIEARYGEALTVRVGVNTGEIVISAADADLVGDALNVAARLEKACAPGEVLVGDDTWRLTRGEIDYEPLGEVAVAGREQPVGTYRVRAAEPTQTETVAPFVGRRGELDRIGAAIDRATGARRATLVTVLGSPGVGKTRLSREAAARAQEERSARAFEIRCDRAGTATFAPVAELIREVIGADEEADPEGVLVRERVGAQLPDDTDRARVVEVLAGVMGVAPARSVEETFWAVRRLVEALAVERPLVVVIDDIQWAEPAFLDLLEHLADWVEGAPVSLVCLARPELRDLRPALVEAGTRVTDVLALDGLDARATAELATGLLGGELPAELVARLPASTDGNPLFVREVVRMLVDDEVIRRDDGGRWVLTIDAEAVDVPPTIQSLLGARIERLPAPELRVLELAAVVGAEFSVGALRAAAGEELALDAVLERLRRKELVEPAGSYWGDEPLYRFHHVLIRDAAYRRLLKTTRAELHLRVGAWTDTVAATMPGEHEAATAVHYELAHRYLRELGSPEAESAPPGRRAATLLAVAAQRALDRDDLTAAGSLARRALQALPGDDVETLRAAAHRVRVPARLGERGRRCAARPRADGGRGRERPAGGLGRLLLGPAREPDGPGGARRRRCDRHRRGRAAGGVRRRRRGGKGAPGAGGAPRPARPRGRGRGRARPGARRRPGRGRPPPRHRGARRRAAGRAVRSEPGGSRRWSLPRRRAPAADHDGVTVRRGDLDALPGGARSAAGPHRRVPVDARVGPGEPREAGSAPRAARDGSVHRHGGADRG